ncbi:MAG: LOG family protein [Proteobacteria bacterium]|nr:LOG family protein [Pseudomonadota bacterium]MCP4915600.1 LOG family protein [Pseudomonadota bacterium]
MSHEKAYKNLEFLNSPAARLIRINCEYEEPRQRFRDQRVRNTIVVFGSARTLPGGVAQTRLTQAEKDLAESPTSQDLIDAVDLAKRKLKNSRYYDDTRVLSRRLTQWGQTKPAGHEYLICTGGGPGIMEAGNRGAADVDGGRSVGLGISLPFEERLNQYVSKDLGFVFHYFFTRKYWFMYLAKAMVVMPGGFGTLDEFAELLTLRQTGKVKKNIPIILYGKDYWTRVLNFDTMIEYGTISEKDLDLFHISDDVDDAYDHVVAGLSK